MLVYVLTFCFYRKTSLLNALRGRTKSGGRVHVEMGLRLNDSPIDPNDAEFRKSVSFVPLEDDLYDTVSVREAIQFSAKLRLPWSTTNATIEKLVSKSLQELGLSTCANKRIGDLSIGEKKRISIGIELIAKPNFLFLDEPTSNLESLAAMQVCTLLKKAANAGVSVLFSIQQPTSEIFSSCFEHLIILQKGRVMFQGSGDSVSEYFAARGFPCPSHFNPGDWALFVAQKHPIVTLEKMGFYATEERFAIKGNLDSSDDSKQKNVPATTNKALTPPGYATQVCMLLKREYVSVRRSPAPTVTRLCLTTFISVLIGGVFFGVGRESPSDSFNLQSQVGGLIVLLIAVMFCAVENAVLPFPKERRVFLRESEHHYSALAYSTSRFLTESVKTGLESSIMTTLIYYLVGYEGSYSMFLAITFALAMASSAMGSFLGGVSSGSEKRAQQLVAVVFLPQLIFSGYFVTPELIPSFLRWCQWLCAFTYSSRLLIVEEFYECSKDANEAERCDNLLGKFDAHPDESALYWGVIAAFFVIFRGASMFFLKP